MEKPYAEAFFDRLAAGCPGFFLFQPYLIHSGEIDDLPTVLASNLVDYLADCVRQEDVATAKAVVNFLDAELVCGGQAETVFDQEIVPRLFDLSMHEIVLKISNSAALRAKILSRREPEQL